ncbi:MAG: Jag N-terminal domain-containing protein [Candidatus Omnitrophica bacterium]|nr:Jag N-terminal domain-containing protein [Candidatus Omnitrophota bacterium]
MSEPRRMVEVEGRTAKEAIDEGLRQLGVGRDQVEIRVLAEENRGLFGMGGAKLAKVRISVKESDVPQTEF